uniref:Integrin, alpha 11a n=1 Tax=Cyprinus carpio TaxID=7962 RepID=A0A8C1MS60_CYPCA
TEKKFRFHVCFNIDTRNHRIIKGPRQTQFGYTVQQHMAGGQKWLLVGAPLETNGQHQTGDVYKCPLSRRSGGPSCTKLNLGRISLTNVSERKDKMRLGMTLSSNPKDNSFVACGPLWSYECGSSYYSTGICSRVNASFKFSRTIAPAFQRCETYMDIVIVLDGSNSIYPWNEVQDFLINILRKFYVGPGQIQVGVLQYGEKVVSEFQLNDFRSVEDVVKAARKIDQRGGEETNTALGINVARSEAFKQGGRRGAKKVMIVITDGESHDSADLQQVIEDSEKDGITRYAIAVLGYYNRRGINPEAFLNEIKYIASDPDDKHFFNVTDEAALKDIVDALGERIFSLEGTSKNGTAFGLQMSQAGFSTHIVEDGILVGAVGAYDWNGAVLKETRQGKVVPPKSSYEQEFPEELKNHGAYLGYTVTSVVSARSGQLYVAGAPRFNHTGKVIIFTLKNTGELTILHSLKGQQIGSYYGSEIAPVDLDDDGVTDNLLVAAPMFFSGGWEKGKVYIYRVTEQPRFILEGSLEILDQGQNARFGSALAPVPDLNGDSFNDVVIGAPLEDDHKGAIYIYHSQRNRILRKYKQRIGAIQLAPGLQYFGRSIHGKMDMNGDDLVDLAVGSLGAAVLLWWVSNTRLFTLSLKEYFTQKLKVCHNLLTLMLFQTCMSFMLNTKEDILKNQTVVAISYNAFFEEKRFNPRAVFDDPDHQQPQNLTLLPGEEKCDHIYFHVMETTDYARPIIFTVETELLELDQGPVLDDSCSNYSLQLPFWNGCDEDDHCVPDLVLQSQTDLMDRKQFCAQAFRAGSLLCRSQTPAEPSERIIEGSRKRMVVDVRLENRGENAYGAQLNITNTPNLRFSSLIVKVQHHSDGLCFSCLFLCLCSEGEEVVLHDNINDISYTLKYEADLLFTRSTSLLSITKERRALMFPTNQTCFLYASQIQNLGYFPIQDLQLYIAIPEVTKNGNQLLQIRDFHIDQKTVPCSFCLLSPTLSHPLKQASVRKTETCFSCHGQLKFKTLELVTTASVELNPSSPMFLPEERPVRHIILEIRKEEDYRVSIWIIIGSTLGGLLLLSLLILALWKVMCPYFFMHAQMHACKHRWI